MDILSPKKIRKLKEDISLKTYKNKILNIMYKINESRLVKTSVLNDGKPNVKVYAREDRYNFAGTNEVEIYVNNGTAFKFDCNEAEQANLSLLNLLKLEDKFG